jgi:hypothetical protein
VRERSCTVCNAYVSELVEFTLFLRLAILNLTFVVRFVNSATYVHNLQPTYYKIVSALVLL